MATTKKQFMITETKVTESGKPDKYTSELKEFAQGSAIANVATASDATAAGNATAINSILAVLRSAGMIANS